jgi:flagellar hook-length control protein FliK
VIGSPIATPETTPAPGATGGVPAHPVGAATGTPAFDAILMLQNLAATAECAETAALEPSEATELVLGEDSGDEEDGEDPEASLAFLSELLSQVPSTPARQFEAGAESGGDGAEEAPTPAATRKVNERAPFEIPAAPEDPANARVAQLTPALAQPVETTPVPEGQASLARAMEMLAPARVAAPAPDRVLHTPARDPRWADELGTRVSLMVRAGESSASLQLTPVDLGPVEVSVTVRDAQATVHFGATQPETRALLEASLPRLREMLAAQGFQLTDASVSSGFSRSQRQEAAAAPRSAAEAETSVTEARVVRAMGLLDLYA